MPKHYIIDLHYIALYYIILYYRVLLDYATDSHTRARLLAVKCKEMGTWLSALPVASLGLRMDNEAVHIAVGLRLGLPLCRPYQCVQCGSQVDKLGTHVLSCRYSKGRHPHHAGVNNVIKRSLDAAQIPSRLEPTGLYRSDGKHPDGASIVLWKCGRALVWDATCPDTLAHFNEQISSREAGAVAAEAEGRKKLKYSSLNSSYFMPVAVETLGVIGPDSLVFLHDLASRIRKATKEPLVLQYLLQRLSVSIQCGNAIAICSTAEWDPSEEFPCL